MIKLAVQTVEHTPTSKYRIMLQFNKDEDLQQVVILNADQADALAELLKTCSNEARGKSVILATHMPTMPKPGLV